MYEKGGGWCSSIASCSARAMTMLGSSTYFEDEVDFQGVLSSDPSLNPGRRTSLCIDLLLSCFCMFSYESLVVFCCCRVL